MARGSVRPATIEDAIYLAPRLRSADRQECLAALGETPEAVLPGSIRQSAISYTMVAPDGTPIGLFGVIPIPGIPLAGAVWLCATPGLVQHATQFLRESRTWIERLHDHFPALINWVDCRNTVHIRWIEWSGFTLIAKREAFGFAQLPFIEFAKVK